MRVNYIPTIYKYYPLRTLLILKQHSTVTSFVGQLDFVLQILFAMSNVIYVLKTSSVQNYLNA